MDLTTRYMGLSLRNPLIASASPLNADIGNLRRLEDAGAGAVVLPSIFEEQIIAERQELELPHRGGGDRICRGANLFPDEQRVRIRAGALSRHRAARQGSDRHSGHRQPELRLAHAAGSTMPVG